MSRGSRPSTRRNGESERERRTVRAFDGEIAAEVIEKKRGMRRKRRGGGGGEGAGGRSVFLQRAGRRALVSSRGKSTGSASNAALLVSHFGTYPISGVERRVGINIILTP